MDEKIKTPASAWGICFATLFIASAGSIALFTVPPAAEIVCPTYGIGPMEIGILMSVFSLASLIFAIPSGWMSDRWGVKTVIVLSAITTALGSVGALFCIGNYVAFLICRCIAGIGMGLCMPAWPIVASTWFPQSTRGIATGIMGSYAGVGTIIALNLFPRIISNSYFPVLLIAAIWGVLALILVCVLNYKPKINFLEIEEKDKIMVAESTWGELVKKPTIWLMFFVFLVFAWVVSGVINTHYPTYLTDVAGVSAATANSMVSLVTGMSLLSFAAGFIMDRIPSRKVSLIAFGIFYFVGGVCLFIMDASPVIWIGLFCCGVASAGMPVACRTFTVENMPAAMTNKALAAITFGTTIGMCLGATAFIALAEATTYKVAGYVEVIGLLLLSLIASFLVKEVKRKSDVAASETEQA